MKRLTIAQPLLFAIYPILSLLASNTDFVRPAEVLLPMAAVAGATVLLYALAAWLLRDREGAAIALSLFWLLFFSFGRILAAIGGANGARERYLLLGCVLLLALVVAVVIRYRGRLHAPAAIMSVLGVALVAMPLLTLIPALLPRAAGRQVAVFGQAELPAALAAEQPLQPVAHLATAAPTPAGGAAVTAAGSAAEEPTRAPTPTLPPRKPDIYYIILDGYARCDVLRDLYDLDNGAFIQWLTGRGFYVAGKSQANYCQTYLSLSSSLNMTYLDELAQRMGEESEDRWPLQELVRDNAIVRLLRAQGYTYAAFSTGYADRELKSADIFKTAPWSLSQFQAGLINTTPISPLISLQYDAHRQRLLFALNHVPDMAATEGPVFVLAHIAAPHPPFVFDENGGAITPNREFMFSDGSHYMAKASREEYVQGYRGQVTYISRQVEAMVDAILARSPDPPVIILQADHGPGSRLSWYSAERTDLRERMSILNAYYLPYGGQERLYEGITPVNTFRVIFDYYFGAGYGLLEDRSYYSTWDNPYRFIPVPPQ